jgi:hypothetical protein
LPSTQSFISHKRQSCTTKYLEVQPRNVGSTDRIPNVVSVETVRLQTGVSRLELDSPIKASSFISLRGQLPVVRSLVVAQNGPSSGFARTSFSSDNGTRNAVGEPDKKVTESAVASSESEIHGCDADWDDDSIFDIDDLETNIESDSGIVTSPVIERQPIAPAPYLAAKSVPWPKKFPDTGALQSAVRPAPTTPPQQSPVSHRPFPQETSPLIRSPAVSVFPKPQNSGSGPLLPLSTNIPTSRMPIPDKRVNEFSVVIYFCC